MRTSGAPRSVAVAAGLMLSSCVIVGDPEPEYGVPTTAEPPTTTAATEGDTEADTEAATTTASTGGESGESGGSDTGASTGGTAADSTSGPEPDYGVATTSG